MSKLNLEILAYEPSPLGLLCLRRRELLSSCAHGRVVSALPLPRQVKLLGASQRVFMDIERAQMAQSAFCCHCVVRGWDERVRAELEVRAFVAGGGLCAATQYHREVCVPELRANRAEVEAQLRAMHASLQVRAPRLWPCVPVRNAPP